jgi:glycosidase
MMRTSLISGQHKWFQEAKKGKDNEFRDFYIWRKPKYDADGTRHPPNNWGAAWGGMEPWLRCSAIKLELNS